MKNIDINDLVNKVDIVDVISNFSKIIKSGNSFKTLCNVHGDKSPSLSINPSKQIYKCFVCDHGGNALDYLLWAQKFSWNQALEFIIKSSGEDVEKYSQFLKTKKYSEKQTKLLKAFKDSSDIFNYYLNIYLEEENEISEFVKKRGLSKKDINKFKLGYAPKLIKNDNYVNLLEKKGNEISILINATLIKDNLDKSPFYLDRLIFPIYDEDNNVVAFSGRKINNLGDSPKYLNSKESLVFKKSSIIYNYNVANKYDSLIIVEGFMDVIAFSKIGYENVIALMGVSISKEILNKLKKHKEILIFLDNDQAGKLATLKLIKHLVLNNIKTYIIANSYSKDADEILNNEKDGKNILSKMIDTKLNVGEFIFDFFTENIDKEDFEQIKKSITEMGEYSKKFDDFLKLDLISKTSKKFGLKSEIISKYFEYETNMIEFNNHLNNENTIKNKGENVANSWNHPLNINRLLISIWKNPSFFKSQNIDNMYWPRAEYKKIYEEIKEYHDNKREISLRTKKFIEDSENFLSKYKESMPTNIDEFNELISRARKEGKNSKIEYIDKLIEETNDEERKEQLLKLKLDLLSRKE